MAEQTDGVAVTATSDFALGLRRMTTDLSAYYLLGYYSTGKLDGRFHAITVRATRPGVQIRARRGYLAASSAAPPAPLESSGAAAGAAEAQAVSSALASLGVLTRDTPLRLHAAVGPASANSRTITAIIEIGRTIDADWGKGAEADASLIDASGATVASSHLSILPASLSVRWAVGPRALPPGDYELRVRAKAASPGSTATDSLRVTVPATVRRRRLSHLQTRTGHRQPRGRHRRSALPPIGHAAGRRTGLGLIGVLGTSARSNRQGAAGSSSDVGARRGGRLEIAQRNAGARSACDRRLSD